MKRTALALALGALSATAVMAASGDAWYGTNRSTITVGPSVTYVEPAPMPSDSVTTYYYAEPATTAPVIVEERTYVTQPYDVVVVDSPPADGSALFHVEPRKYGTVYNDGLFARKGPNDFGS